MQGNELGDNKYNGIFTVLGYLTINSTTFNIPTTKSTIVYCADLFQEVLEYLLNTGSYYVPKYMCFIENYYWLIIKSEVIQHNA